jgi:hypothetical protein
LQKAIDLGEYEIEYLSSFPEWHELSSYLQFQYIKQALDNRYRQLVVQWSEINNVLNFSQKPEMQKALENIEKQIKKVEKDREQIYFEDSKKI